MRVLVTGAAGFLGGHLVEMLRERGYEVRAFVRTQEDISHLRSLPEVEIVYGDVTDIYSVKRAMRGIECVYNVAARTGPWGLEEDYRTVNVQGLSNVLSAAMGAGVKRIVHSSSITVYGHHLRGIIDESHAFYAEDNPYSRSKIAGERLISNLVREQRAPVVVVRPGWIYGPRDTASFARFVRLIELGKGFMIGRGNNSISLVYVRDVAQGLIKAGTAGEEVIGRAYTLVGDRSVTQAEYLHAIADTLHVPRVRRHLPYIPLYIAGRGAEVGWRLAGRRSAEPPPITTYGVTLLGSNQQFSIERARKELGYTPEYDVRRGVIEGIYWYKNVINAIKSAR